MFTDKIVKCRDCGLEFVFSASEQDYFAEKGLSDPVRCLRCRQARKQEGPGGLKRGFGQQREMYPVICACCGARARVPFRPSIGRPVYCRDCFIKKQYRDKRNSLALG